MSAYDSEKLLHEYLCFHYGTPEEILPWAFGPKDALDFAQRSVTALLSPGLLPTNSRALDLGCAVGRSSYVLAQHASDVLGIDYSHSFVQAAEHIRQEGALSYTQLISADRSRELIALRPIGGSPKNIRFQQGDAMALPPEIGSFDIVHAANLLCRLTEPQRLLERLPALVRPGGQLLLTTPCTWLEEFTPPEHWPQGSTQTWLREKLSPAFDLEDEVDLPFLIREHERKFQWSVAWGTRWIRKV